MIRILIADDHPAVRQGLQETLQDEYPQMQIEVVEETTMLIDRALNGTWDLIVSDLYMPGGGGLHMLEKLRENNTHTPVFIISMFPADQFEQRVKDAGANRFISKSTLPDALLDAINELIKAAEK